MQMRAPVPLLPLALEGVSFVAGGRTIIDAVTLELDAGTRSIFIGPNGAGKSVLLRLCHGLLRPTSGSVRWNAAEAAHAPRRQAMVFQRPMLLRRSVLANVLYALEVNGVPRGEREERAADRLERVGLLSLAHRPARVLSGGEQQRLALARAWALRPEVLFLDEPSASLDPGATHEIEAIVRAMHDGGTKIVMVTHNLGQARRMGDEILFMHRGRIAERASADAFFRQPASPEAARFIEGELPW